MKILHPPHWRKQVYHQNQFTGWTLTGVARSGSKQLPPRRITGLRAPLLLWPPPATFTSRPAPLRGRGVRRPRTAPRGRTPAPRCTRGCQAPAAARGTARPTAATWRSATTTRSTTHPWTAGAKCSLNRRKSRKIGLKVRLVMKTLPSRYLIRCLCFLSFSLPVHLFHLPLMNGNLKVPLILSVGTILDLLRAKVPTHTRGEDRRLQRVLPLHRHRRLPTRRGRGGSHRLASPT